MCVVEEGGGREGRVVVVGWGVGCGVCGLCGLCACVRVCGVGVGVGCGCGWVGGWVAGRVWCVCGRGGGEREGGGGRVVSEMSMTISLEEHATNSGDRTPGSQTPGVPVTPALHNQHLLATRGSLLALDVRMDGVRKTP